MPEEKSPKAAPAPAEKKAAPASGGSDDTKLIGALCYIIGIIVPLYVLLTEKKNDKFLAFHAWQSLLITVVWFVVYSIIMVGTLVLGFALAFVTAGFGTMIIPCVMLVVLLVLLVMIVFLAWKAYQGERYKLPVLGDFAEKQANK